MVKIFTGIVVFLAVAVLLLQIDDDLDDDVQRFLAQSKIEGDSKAYRYLLGMAASKDEQPLVAGSRILKKIRAAEDKYFNKDVKPEDFLDYSDEKILAYPEDELFCLGIDEGCISHRMSKEHDLDAVINTHSILLERYQTFLKMNDYHNLSKPMQYVTFPPYGYLAKGNRLVILQAINEAHKSNITKASEIIIQNITLLRSQLKQSGMLIGKMVYLMQISDNLDMLSVLVREAGYTHDYSFEPLSLDERNFDDVMIYEFAFMYDVIKNYHKEPELDLLDDYNLPGWMMKTFLKPNMTLNAIYPNYKHLQKLAKVEQQEFARIIEAKKYVLPEHSYIRNLLGNVYLESPDEMYAKYVARVFDLNVKIALTNEVLRSGDNAIRLSNIQNPYYESSDIAYYSADMNSICLRGPLPDERGIRCLRVKV